MSPNEGSVVLVFGPKNLKLRLRAPAMKAVILYTSRDRNNLMFLSSEHVSTSIEVIVHVYHLCKNLLGQ